ncbi:MAG TPA: filamentous hemagglutinin N-terminal domain-containing protein [Candidatus Acidoferrum sp.]|nr:filamentous hemagglutinin N-terminal domain-containing protein [Candidatus Acidoferrum sp.]
MKIWHRHHFFQRALAGMGWLGIALAATANPTGLTVQHGSATATVNGSQVTITASQNAFLNWQSFNIAAGETTIFNQPSATSIVWNQINDPNPSRIFGNLQANGVVVLLNSSGFYFGPNSFVSAAGLVVSTANCVPPQNSGGAWEFNGPPPLASIVNYGRINIGHGGSAFLIADRVENHGSIEAPGGTIGLAAGQTVLLSERPDGRGLSLRVTLPQGSVDNEGRLIADGGTIAMRAQVVNQNGYLQADAAQNINGTIELVAADQLNLGADSQILARGDDASPGSNGGNVTLKAGNRFGDDIGSLIEVNGGAQGGNGGNVEICAANVQSLNSSIDARAQTGWTAGKLFLDPDFIVLGTSGTGSAGGGTVLATDNAGTTLNLNVNTAFANLAVSQIILQAAYDITVAGGTSWNLSQTIGANFGGVTSGQLTLEAGRNIILNAGSSITDVNNWSLALYAGVGSFSLTTPTVQSGVGSILLNGGSSQTWGSWIRTAAGSISLTAGKDILVNADKQGNSGFVITTGGGSICAHALAGNIDTGDYAQGYHFDSGTGPAYDLNSGLGGISTAAGGDVTLIAGGNVTSLLPGKGTYYFDGTAKTPGSAAHNGSITDYYTAGTGAYGPEAGDVTVIAGGNVAGHYLVANGTGRIFAGVKMDADGNPLTDGSGNYVLGTSGSAGKDLANNSLALSLISGGWNVTAAQNIRLQEVRNPNGVFNDNHIFDYAPDAYVNLSAGNTVQLASTIALPRLSSGVNINVPVIYPSILDIQAGAGGVVLGAAGSTFTSLILYPSPQGSLIIDTTDGGPLVSALSPVSGGPQVFNLIVSDAGHNNYTATLNFGINDHAASPIHLGNSTPIQLDISGNLKLISLVAPEAAQINVGDSTHISDMVNCTFQAVNLGENDVTSISVTGDIYNRSSFTDVPGVTPEAAANLFYLAQAVNNPLSATTLASSFYYNPATQTLTYQNIPGWTLPQVFNLLNNLTVQVYVNGVAQFTYDANGHAIPVTTTVSVLDSATQSALQTQFNALGGIPYNATPGAPTGYFIGGGGQLDITARTIDLGTSAGIQSKGVALYTVRGTYPLAGLFGNGGVFDRAADIIVTTTGQNTGLRNTYGDFIGDLDMYSSSIASLSGGNITLDIGGDVNAGSAVFTVNSLAARGIYSTGQGNVSVTANGNVNVNGSRIASYDGGSVTVISRNGDINAGNGGAGYVIVQQYSVDASTHAVTAPVFTIPGSGILATTLPDSPNIVGNILVETPNGNVNASSGGIVQLPLNNVASGSATVTVLAGEDATGNIISAGRNIDASGSGVIGSTVVLKASGDIIGAIFARDNLDINAVQNVNVTALSQGTATVNAGETLSGTIIGVGGISAAGTSVDASLLSNNAISGETSGQSGLGQGTAANSASQSMQSEDVAKAADATDETSDDEKKKKGKEVALTQKAGRVTVLLPPRQTSPSPNPGT